MSFAETLRNLRLQAAMSQSAVANAAGIDRTMLSKMEHGYRPPPDRSTVLALAAAMKLTPAQTDKLLESAGYAPQSVLDIPGLDLRDEKLRGLLHGLAEVRAEGGPQWAAVVEEALSLLLQGARLSVRTPSLVASTLAAPPPSEAIHLTTEEQELDDRLSLILAGKGETGDIAPLEEALARGHLPWELRRRLAEALPQIARLDIQAGLRIAKVLRGDYDPDKWHADLRRRVIEAVPALYAHDSEARKLLEPRPEDQVWMAIATVEAMHDIPDFDRQEAARIRRELGQRERPEHAGVVEFLSGLLDLIADGKLDEALTVMRAAREKERVFRVCIARSLWRLLPTRPVEALWMMLHFLRRVEGRPAEHANVRRPMAMMLPKIIALLDGNATSVGTLARVVIHCLAQDEDVLIRRAVADDLAGLAARDAPLAQEIITYLLMVDRDPYIRRRAWKGLIESGLEKRDD